MLKVLIYSMIYLGSALMVYNIIAYFRYVRHLREHGEWDQERWVLNLPLILLISFLVGYLAVGLIGKPDLIVSGILFGGSIFVAIIVFLLRRITNRITENEKLQAKLMAVEASNQAKTSFLSNMSHEMRTPMNAILGLVRLSQEDKSLSEQTRDHLNRIDASARHLLSLINDILNMSYIDAGTLELKNKRFSFGEMMMQVNSMVSAECQDKGLNYNSESIGNIDKEFIGDELKLKHVLLSAADNAIKFTDAPGSVRCTVEQLESDEDTRLLRVVIQDTGIGMDEEFLSHVFEAFSREDVSNTNARGGSGLGLTLSRSIAEMMGGGIDIQSTKGVGTTVTMTFRLGAVADEREAETPAQAPSDVLLEGRRILIAEDIDLNAEILADLLELEGMESERGENGQIALDMFASSEPGYYDAVLMDLRMPVMDGLEAARRIRALDRPDAKTVPILALTANAFEEDVKASMEAGMNVHLPKPADMEMLCAALRTYLR